MHPVGSWLVGFITYFELLSQQQNLKRAWVFLYNVSVVEWSFFRDRSKSDVS